MDNLLYGDMNARLDQYEEYKIWKRVEPVVIGTLLGNSVSKPQLVHLAKVLHDLCDLKSMISFREMQALLTLSIFSQADTTYQYFIALGRLVILMEIYVTTKAGTYARLGGGYLLHGRPSEQATMYIADIRCIIYSNQELVRHLTKMVKLIPHPRFDWCEQVNSITRHTTGVSLW